jgi:hypothetical protein
VFFEDADRTEYGRQWAAACGRFGVKKRGPKPKPFPEEDSFNTSGMIGSTVPEIPEIVPAIPKYGNVRGLRGFWMIVAQSLIWGAVI